MVAKFMLWLWLGFLTGVLLGSVFSSQQNLLFFCLIFSLVSFLLSLYIPAVRILAVLLMGLTIGYIYVGMFFPTNEYQNSFNHDIDTEAVIAKTPEPVSNGQQIVLLPDGQKQFLLASSYFPIDVKKGDRVWVRGKVTQSENFSEFDYVSYLKRHNIFAQLKSPRIIVIERSQPGIYSVLMDFKVTLIKHSQTVYSGDVGSLIMGMLIGYRKTISDELEEVFRRVGMTHIVAVSGFNMTIIAVSCGGLAWYLGRRRTGYLTIATVISFALITGATASVVRAAIMALLMVYAYLSGRLYAGVHALVWTAGLMAVHNPLIVFWDIGFQLSIAATTGLFVVFRWKEDTSDEIKLGIADIARSTIGAIIFTAPLIAFHFQAFSLSAFPVNIMLLPLVPWVMLFGALGLLPLVGTIFSIVAELLVSIMITTAEKFASLPISSISIQIGWQEVVLYYLFLLLICFIKFDDIHLSVKNDLKTGANYAKVK